MASDMERKVIEHLAKQKRVRPEVTPHVRSTPGMIALPVTDRRATETKKTPQVLKIKPRNKRGEEIAEAARAALKKPLDRSATSQKIQKIVLPYRYSKDAVWLAQFLMTMAKSLEQQTPPE